MTNNKLVERLLALANNEQFMYDDLLAASIVKEAANEIERLEKEVAAAQQP